MGQTLIILIYILGLGLMFAELLIPGFIMGLTGLTGVVGCIVAAFALGETTLGWILLGVTGIAVPIFFIIWINILKRYFTLNSNQSDYSGWRKELYELQGKEGVTLTTLRPVGQAMIEGKRVDVVAAEGVIEKGTAIKVVDVKSNRVLVRAVTA